MTFGAAPSSGAHGHRNPMMPRKDLAAETGRPPVPAVPRAPRGAPKQNPLGTLAREAVRNGKEACSVVRASTPTSSSERRRPREDSPFARISSLTREREASENQTFEHGPARTRPASAGRDGNHRRSHALGKEQAMKSGMPWGSSDNRKDDSAVDGASKDTHARRSTLRHEQEAADQAMEWASAAAPVAVSCFSGKAPGGENFPVTRSYGRRSVLAQEEATPAVTSLGCCSVAAAIPQSHGRRNVLRHEIERQAAPVC